MHATLVVLIDREREEQKLNTNDGSTGSDLPNVHSNHVNSAESNAFIQAYQVCRPVREIHPSIHRSHLDGVY